PPTAKNSPWATLITSSTPKIRLIPTAISAYSPPSTMPCTTKSAMDSHTSGLAEVEPPDLRAVAQLRGRAVEGVLPEVEHEDVMGRGEDHLHVLFGDEERDAGPVQSHNRLVDTIDEARRQRGRRLVQQHQARTDHEGARHGQDALLAAAETACHLAPALVEEGKTRVPFLECPAAPARSLEKEPAEAEVLVDSHLREEPARLGQITHPQAEDLIGSAADQIVPVELHAPGPRAKVAEDRLQQRRFASAIGTDEPHD